MPKILPSHRQHLLTCNPLSVCNSKARVVYPRGGVSSLPTNSPVSGVNAEASDSLTNCVFKYLREGGLGVGERIHLCYHKDLHALKDAVAKDFQVVMPYARVTAECIDTSRKELRVSLGVGEEVVFECSSECQQAEDPSWLLKKCTCVSSGIQSLSICDQGRRPSCQRM